MKLSNEYINKQYLINMLGCVHPEDRNWEEAIGIIEDCGVTEAYPINWIDTDCLTYNLDDIRGRPYVIALPVKIGDTILADPSLNMLFKNDGHLRKGKVVAIKLDESGVVIGAEFGKEETNNNTPIAFNIFLDEINQRVFLRR